MDVSLVLSIISLVVAILVAITSYAHRRRAEAREIERDQRKIGIRVLDGRVQFGSNAQEAHSTVEVRVINEGFRPIKIQSVDLLDGDGKRLFIEEFLEEAPSGIPKVLPEGDAVSVHFWRGTDVWNLEERGKKGEKVRAAWVQDVYGGVWTEPIPDNVLTNLP